jgi:SAM-dependent methyltransferase
VTRPAPALDRRRFRRWVDAVRLARPERPPLALTGLVAAWVSDTIHGVSGGPWDDITEGERLERSSWPEPGWASPRLPGLVYEALTAPADRRQRGAWFTPAAVVDDLVERALDGGFDPQRVLDPACGGGAFLLGVADALARRGLPPHAVAARLAGIDLDPGAVQVTGWALTLWDRGAGGQPTDRWPPPGWGATTPGWLAGSEGGPGLVVGDGLAEPVDPVDLVVGNPPFASPLHADRSDTPAARWRSHRPHLGPYADAAACFLDRAADLVAPGGRVVLVLPQSLLAGRDSAGLRARFSSGWVLRQLWITPTPVFDAAVHVFAPVLERTDAPSSSGPTTLGGLAPGADPTILGGLAARADPPLSPFSAGRSGPAGPAQSDPVTRGGQPRRPGLSAGRPGPAGSAPAAWAERAASALGIPPVVPPAGGAPLASLATATAGFRDEHYGLVAACREGDEAPGGDPVVTVGQIDPLRWKRDGPIRFGGRRWARPVVDTERLAPPLAGWVARQQRPKVLLATQTRILEPLIDRTGRLIPSTPVIALHADPEDLDRVAAVLLAPPVVALAARRSVGTSLHPHGIKLAARQVTELPLPCDPGAWSEAAALLAPLDAWRAAPPGVLWAVAGLMCRAYRHPVEPLRSWWWERRPDS